MKYELLWQDALHKTDTVFKSDSTAKMLVGDMSMAIQGVCLSGSYLSLYDYSCNQNITKQMVAENEYFRIINDLLESVIACPVVSSYLFFKRWAENARHNLSQSKTDGFDH